MRPLRNILFVISDQQRADHPGLTGESAVISGRLFAWLRGRRHRITVSDSVLEARTGTAKERGYHIGVW